MLRARRREHVAALPESTRALILHRPPAPLLDLIPAGAVIGTYHATANEAPAGGYTRFFSEAGHTVALPYFETADAVMDFRIHSDPFGETDLEAAPFGALQPGPQAEAVVPDVLIAPLIGFTAAGERLGQGGGHYDRWLADHPGTRAIGLAWDCQLVDELPTEAHDMPMTAIVTPTRLYGPF